MLSDEGRRGRGGGSLGILVLGLVFSLLWLPVPGCLAAIPIGFHIYHVQLPLEKIYFPE